MVPYRRKLHAQEQLLSSGTDTRGPIPILRTAVGRQFCHIMRPAYFNSANVLYGMEDPRGELAGGTMRYPFGYDREGVIYIPFTLSSYKGDEAPSGSISLKQHSTAKGCHLLFCFTLTPPNSRLSCSFQHTYFPCSPSLQLSSCRTFPARPRKRSRLPTLCFMLGPPVPF